MGFITNISSEYKIDITFYSKVISVVNGITQPESWTEIKTVKGLQWFGTQGLNLTSDKLKTNVDGAISIDYDSTIAVLTSDAKFVVDSADFEILYIENVGMQSEVLQIMYKRVNSN